MKDFWISVKDRLPETLSARLCYDSYYSEQAVAYYDEKNSRWYLENDHGHSDFNDDLKITHWQPLPPPPGKR